MQHFPLVVGNEGSSDENTNERSDSSAPTCAGEVRLNRPVDFMRLTLFYRGPLHAASKSDPRSDEKHRIRRYFHRQLADLWETHPALDDVLKYWKEREA